MKAKFTISYHYQHYHTGNINEKLTRTAIVYADNLDEAISKVIKLDDNFICIADNGVIAEEIKENDNEKD